MARTAKRSSFIFSRLGFIVIAIILYIGFLSPTFGGEWDYFYIVNFTIAMFSIVCMTTKNVPSFSSYRAVFAFVFILFAITPALEFKNQVLYQTTRLEIFNDYTRTSIIILMGIIAFYFGFSVRVINHTKFYRFTLANPLFLILTSATVCAFILAYNSFSIVSLYVRGGELDLAVGSGSLDLIFKTAILPIPTCALTTYLAFSKERNKFILLTLSLLALIFNFPTGMPRYQAAALYLAVLYAYRPSIFRSPVALPALLIFGTFLIFPLAGILRNLNDLNNIVVNFNTEFVYGGAFDSFQNFVILREGLQFSYGYQALGAFFFFIPRSIWSSKPIETATQLALDSGFPHTNISLNLLGEGYANFGLIGVILFGFAFGVLCSVIDKKLHFGSFSNASSLMFAMSFPALAFFIMRGGFISGVSYTLGMFACYWILSLFIARQRVH